MTVIKSAQWSVLRPSTAPTAGLQAVKRSANVGEAGERSRVVLKENRDLYSPSGGHPIAEKLRGVQGALRTYQLVTALAQGAGYTLREVRVALEHLQQRSDQALDPAGEGDSQYLQHEINQITRNIGDLFQAYRFGQSEPFDGEFLQKQLALGGNRERSILGPVTPEAITVSLSELEPETLGGGVFVISRSGVSSVLTLTQSGTKGGALTLNDFQVSESVASDDTLSTIDHAESAIAKAAAINRLSEESGVYAFALPTRTDNQGSLERHLRGVDAHLPSYLGNTGPIQPISLDSDHQLIINGVAFEGVEVSLFDEGEQLRNAINARSEETGISASLSEASELVLSASDGRNIHVAYSDGVGGATEQAIGLLSYRGVAYGGRLMLTSEEPFTLDMAARVNESMGDLVGDYRFSGAHTFEESNLFSIDRYDVVSDSGRRASPLVLARAIEQLGGELDYLDALESFLLETPTRIYQGLIGEGIDEAAQIGELDDALKLAKSVGSFLLASQDESVVSQSRFQPKLLSALLDGTFINSQIPAGLRSLLPPESLAGASLEVSARLSNLQSARAGAPVGLFEERYSLVDIFNGDGLNFGRDSDSDSDGLSFGIGNNGFSFGKDDED